MGASHERTPNRRGTSSQLRPGLPALVASCATRDVRGTDTHALTDVAAGLADGY